MRRQIFLLLQPLLLLGALSVPAEAPPGDASADPSADRAYKFKSSDGSWKFKIKGNPPVEQRDKIKIKEPGYKFKIKGIDGGDEVEKRDDNAPVDRGESRGAGLAWPNKIGNEGDEAADKAWKFKIKEPGYKFKVKGEETPEKEVEKRQIDNEE